MNKFYAILITLFAFASIQAQEMVTITDADLGAETYNWTSDKTYLLDGFVFLEEGGVLNIEAGTVVKGIEAPSTSDNASALIITRGAQIFANGAEDAPIIFTSEIDDTNDAEDLTPNDRGLWGGLIILGNAVIANPTPETRIEGIPEGEDRALFGGMDDTDNSGSLSYV
ncbi:MAG: T9SS C-terminal target domain-containing protein, partial [Bacteroidota bacterium]